MSVKFRFEIPSNCWGKTAEYLIEGYFFGRTRIGVKVDSSFVTATPNDSTAALSADRLHHAAL